MISIAFLRHKASAGTLIALLVTMLGMPQANAADRCTVRQAQQALTDQGYEPGPVDGAMGRRTRNAIRAFQRDNDLRANGRLNKDTCRMLTEPPAPAPKPEPEPELKVEPEATKPAASEETVPKTDTEAAPTNEADNAKEAENTSAGDAPNAPAAGSATQPVAPEVTPAVAAPPPEPGYKRISDPLALYRTAFGLHKSGAYHIAVSAFEHYLRTFPDHDRVPDALYWVSEAYLEIGMDQEARESLEQLLAKFPGHRHEADARSRLDGISPVTQ